MLKRCLLCVSILLCLPTTLYASLIESTMGTAIVNDATAVYHNPAALTLLKNPQVVGLGSVAYFRTQFSGQTFQPSTGFRQQGNASTRTHYFLPTLYFAMPANQRVVAGVAVEEPEGNKDENTRLLESFIKHKLLKHFPVVLPLYAQSLPSEPLQVLPA